MNQNAILTYISSSELNRCKKNGLNLLHPRSLWIDVLKYEWLTRKLRRKIGHLFQMGLLPTIPKRTVGLFTPDKYADNGLYNEISELRKMLLDQFLKAEDEQIMKGLSK